MNTPLNLMLKLCMTLTFLCFLGSCSSTEEAAEDPTDLEASEPSEESEAPPAEPAPEPTTVVPEAATSLDPAPAAPPAAPSVPSTDRVVRYVKVKSATLRDKPDAKANAVGSLRKCDHILITVEGDWGRTDDGKYIAVKDLSDRGVGRPKKNANWKNKK